MASRTREAEVVYPRQQRKGIARKLLAAAWGGALLYWGMRRRGPIAWAMRLWGARMAGRAVGRGGRVR